MVHVIQDPVVHAAGPLRFLRSPCFGVRWTDSLPAVEFAAYLHVPERCIPPVQPEPFEHVAGPCVSWLSIP